MSYYEWATSGGLEAFIREYVRHEMLDARKMRLAACALTREHYVFDREFSYEQFASLPPATLALASGDCSGFEDQIPYLHETINALATLSDIAEVELLVDDGVNAV